MENISFRKEGGVVTAAPAGRIDSVNAKAFGQSMAEIIEGAEKVIVDMSGLLYISSAALREFLKLQKTLSKKGVPLVLTGVSDDIRDIFIMTHMNELITIE